MSSSFSQWIWQCCSQNLTCIFATDLSETCNCVYYYKENKYVWAMCDTVAPAAFIPMTCHRWLMALFPMTKSNWPVTKSWLLGWPKLRWFQLYCSKTIRSISLICARHVTRYIHIILAIFQEATQCLTVWTISLENFCNNFFPGVYVSTVRYFIIYSPFIFIQYSGAWHVSCT